MTSNLPASCSVEGAAHLPGANGEQDICKRFEQDFYEALEGKAAEEDFSIALTVTKGGTISAIVTAKGGRTFPEVAVDVMDRDLNYSDLSQLADAAARVVITG